MGEDGDALCSDLRPGVEGGGVEVEEVRRDKGVTRASLRVGASSSLSLGTGVFSRKKKGSKFSI